MGKWEMVKLGDVCTGTITNIAQKDLSNNNGDYPIYGASGFIKFVDFYKQDKPYIAVVKDGAGVGRVSRMPAKSSIIGTMQNILPNENIDVNYLYYAMLKMKLGKFYTGATIPHIYFKDYKNEELLFPPLLIQQKIADVLDHANALIEKCKVQIEKLDLLVKSQFIEMFGDPVRNPMGWEVKRLEQITNSRLGKMLDTKQQTGKNSYPYLANSNVQWFRFDLNTLNKMDFDEADREEFNLKYGDLLVCEGGEVGRTAIWRNERQNCFFQKALHRVRCNFEICVPEYLAWVMYYKATITNFDGLVTSATIAHLTGEKLKMLELQLPPLELQNQFAAFVERVEAQKAQMKKGLALMKLEYKSLMQKCFNGEMF